MEIIGPTCGNLLLYDQLLISLAYFTKIASTVQKQEEAPFPGHEAPNRNQKVARSNHDQRFYNTYDRVRDSCAIGMKHISATCFDEDGVFASIERYKILSKVTALIEKRHTMMLQTDVLSYAIAKQ